MASGNSGTISVTGTKNMSAVLYWSETYNVASNTHVVSTENVAPETVSLIKQKAATGNLSVEDVLSTPFSELNTWDDEEYWEWHLGDFVNLPESSSGIVFCGDGDGGWFFFSTEEELITAFEKDSSDYNFGEKWADLDDTLLEQWYMRIFSPGVDFELPMTLDITK